MRPARPLAALGLLVALSACARGRVLERGGEGGRGADWPCWRGPRGDGKSEVAGIRRDWSGGLGKLWEVEDLCRGEGSDTYSAVSVSGGRLVVPGRLEERDAVFCFDARSGELLWKREYPAPGESSWGSGPRATPAIDRGRVYTFGCMGHLACWRLEDGERCWLRDVREEGGTMPVYGYASSPLVHGDLVIVLGGGRAYAIAFHKEDGRVAWRSDLTGPAGYAAPLAAGLGGTLRGRDRTVIIFGPSGGPARDGHDPGRIAGLDPRSGRTIWESPWWARYDCFAATPAVEGRHVLVTTEGGSALLRVDGPAVATVWEHWRDGVLASAHSDSVIAGGYIYGTSGPSTGDGVLQSVELETGSLKWSAASEAGRGTLVLVDGHLLCLGNRGDLFLVEARPEGFRTVSEFRGAIPGERVWTVPVVAGGRLYLRHQERLLCYTLEEAARGGDRGRPPSRPGPEEGRAPRAAHRRSTGHEHRARAPVPRPRARGRVPQRGGVR